MSVRFRVEQTAVAVCLSIRGLVRAARLLIGGVS